MILQGYLVGVTWRRRELLEKIQSQHPDNIKFRAFDIWDLEACIKGIEELKDELWWVDIFILWAWTWFTNPSLSFDIEYETIKTNVIWWTAIADWTIDYFIQQKKWHFVAITSISALRWMWDCPSYNATKAYQSNYIESLRLYVDKKKISIKILEVQPWFVNTRMAQWNLFWVCSLPKASEQIREAIEKSKKHIYLSKRWRLITWVMKLSPYRIYRKVVNSM
jgi:short-subunit dehydrogenase